MSVPMDDEGSFAAGRQALLDALQSLEQRAHDRAERMLRDAERTARQLTLDSEQRAYQLTTDAEERARQSLADAEQRSKQVTLETASRLAELEQQLAEVRDQLEAARGQIEEQVVTVRGQVEVARASLNTIRQQLTSGAPARPPETSQRINPVPRPSVPRLGGETSAIAGARLERQRMEEEVAPSLNDLRAAVEALRQPHRIEPPPPVNEARAPLNESRAPEAAADRPTEEQH